MSFQVHLAGSDDLVVQVYRQVREVILDGRLRAGERLPPSREPARSAAVSRNTVSTAYERWLAEGFVTARLGSGTFVDGTAAADRPAGTATAGLATVPVTRWAARHRPGSPAAPVAPVP